MEQHCKPRMGVGQIWLNGRGTISFECTVPTFERQLVMDAETIPSTRRPTKLITRSRANRFGIDMRTGQVDGKVVNRQGLTGSPMRLVQGLAWVSAEDLFRLKMAMTCAKPEATSGSGSGTEDNEGFIDALDIEPCRRRHGTE